MHSVMKMVLDFPMRVSLTLSRQANWHAHVERIFDEESIKSKPYKLQNPFKLTSQQNQLVMQNAVAAFLGCSFPPN